MNRLSGSYQRLIRYKTGPEVAPGEIILVPDLAESWEVSKDGLTFTFHLRKGVKWQNVPPVNGREFVADDVVWSYNRIAKSPGSIYATWFSLTEKIEALDRYTVKITNKEPYAAFIMSLADPFAVITAREVAEADGDLNKRVIGTGPFVMAQRLDNVVTKLRRNPNYWEAGIPYVDGYEIFVIPEPSASLAAFRAGKLDLISSTSKTDVDSVLRSRPNTQLIKTVSTGWSRFVFRTDKKPWNNQKLRQAFSVALDRQAAIDTLFDGEGTFPTVMPLYPGWTLPVEKLGEASKYWKHDTGYAKQLLAEAGYPNGVELPFTVRQADTDKALIYVSSLLKAGIKLKVQVLSNTEWQATTQIGKYEGASWIPGGPGTPDAGEYLTLLYHSKSELYNTAHVNDPFVDKMLEEQRRTLDEGKRKKLIQDLQPYLADKMFYAPVAGGVSYSLANARMGGYMPSVGQNAFDVYRYVWIEGAK